MLDVANLEISTTGIFWILFASSQVKSCGCSKLRKFKKFAITEASLSNAVTTDHSKCQILYIVHYIISKCRTSWLALHVVFTRCQLHQLLGTSCISIPLLWRNTKQVVEGQAFLFSQDTILSSQIFQKGINWNSKVKFIAFRRMYETTRSTDPTEEKSKLVCYPRGDLLSQTLKWAVNSRCILLPALSMIWIRQSQCSWCEELHLLQDTELNFVIRQLNSGTVIITDYVLIKVFTYSCCCRLHWS